LDRKPNDFVATAALRRGCGGAGLIVSAAAWCQIEQSPEKPPVRLLRQLREGDHPASLASRGDTLDREVFNRSSAFTASATP
jgi:hypothetical protein